MADRGAGAERPVGAGHEPPPGRMRYDARLDPLNFLLADVRGGLGPYVGVFLVTRPAGTPPPSAPC